MIRSVFQKPAAPSSKPGPGLFRKPENQPVDGFRSSHPATAFKPAVMGQPKETPVSAGLVSSRSPLVSTAAALPASMSGLYTSLLKLLSDRPEGASQLESLAEGGRLTPATLKNLHELTDQPRAAGLDGAELTRETLAILSAPDRNIWQGNRFTCGATNLERQLADDPERFTALVNNLSGIEGKTYLVSGSALARVEGSQREDGSGRSSADRLIQSSLMSLAGSSRGAYDVATDRFANDSDGGGLKIAEISALTALAQNQPQVVIAYGSQSARAVQELLTLLKPGETFQTAMTNWEGKDHMLLLQGCQGGQITYFDPADHSQHSIGMRDYLWKTQYLVLPQSIAERVQFDPETIHSRADRPHQE